jgi:Leucine-rich repeat (LRR) protein
MHAPRRPSPRPVVVIPLLLAALLGLPAAPPVAAQAPAAAAKADVAAARKRIADLGGKAVVDEAGRLVEIAVEDGSEVTADDVALLGRLTDLKSLRILNCRDLDDAMLGMLTGLSGLTTLAVTNSGITDAGVEAIVKAFPGLVELDLSSNTNLTGATMKSIAGLAGLKRLLLVQNRFNDLSMRRLAKMPAIEVLDLRGNMEAGDLTLEAAGGLPGLRSLKHRSSAVTDLGMEKLAAAANLESLLMQDFVVTSGCGPALAKLGKLSSLEIFRCQGFGSDGVLALAGMPLTRLTLRDLPDVGDRALEVAGKLPQLKRLYLHELASVGDEGIAQLAGAKQLEVLDIWSLPLMTDASIEAITRLPALRELSIRETGVTEAAIGKILAMEGLKSLTFKNNGPLSKENAAKLAARKWTKLDLGAAETP